MQELFLEILRMSLIGSVIALVVIGIRPLLRRAPKWTLCLLWALVALRLVCPVSPESDLSLVPDRVATGQIISNVGSDYVGEVNILYASNAGYSNALSAGRVPVYTGGESYIVTRQGSLDPPVTVADSLYPVLSWVWLAGVGMMMAYCVISYAVLRRRMAEATHLREEIWQSEKVASPFVLGFFRPRIYLPYTIREADMAHVIAHERSHIIRRDHWWKPLGFVLLSIHWFNPVLWVSYILLCRDIESACDERVIRNMEKREKQAYSTALLHCSTHRKTIAACPLAFGEVSVKERVKNVMHYKKPAFWVIVVAVVLCIAVAVCFLTNPPTPSLEALPLVHSHNYLPYTILYENTSLHYTEPLNADMIRYTVTEDMHLQTRSLQTSYTGWIDLGLLEETELTKENFDDLFFFNTENTLAKDTRKNTANAWRLLTEDGTLYYLLQQKNGELYLAIGDRNHDREPEPVIRWLFELENVCLLRRYFPAEKEYGLYAISGENVVPLTIFPAGTAIGNYVKSIHWLTIDPGEDFIPFRTYQNGEELLGIYNVYDAETYEPIPTVVPSGLEPQTYLFQNADPEREYIVVMMRSYEPDAEIYCFGIRFPENLEDAPQTMIPTDSALDGVFDRYLYMTIDGTKFRYECQETMPGGIQAGLQAATFYEDSGFGDRYQYTVFSVKGCEDNSMFLLHSHHDDRMWLYKYSPAKASTPNALQNAKDEGYVVMEDGDVTFGQEIWLDFYEKTLRGQPATVKYATWYTLDPETCSDQYYEAYREDYPCLYLHELTYDGESYTLRWNEYGTEYVRTYEYLMRYTDTTGTNGTQAIRYVLTHDSSVTWDQILRGMYSSAFGDFIDHYTVCVDRS